MKSSGETLSEVIGELTDKFIVSLDELAEEPYLREAIAKIAMRDVSWALNRTFEFDIYAEMRTLAEVIREAD